MYTDEEIFERLYPFMLYIYDEQGLDINSDFVDFEITSLYNYICEIEFDGDKIAEANELYNFIIDSEIVTESYRGLILNDKGLRIFHEICSNCVKL